ncbi:MAG: hypothetical protein ABIP81_06105, partial [Terriglobales bacterium]
LVGMLSLGDVAVKQQDDRLSGDVLQEVSKRAKTDSDASNMDAPQGGSRSGVKTSTADCADDASGKWRSNETLNEDARPTSRYDSLVGGNRGGTQAHDKVLPFLDRHGKDRKKAS